MKYKYLSEFRSRLQPIELTSSALFLKFFHESTHSCNIFWDIKLPLTPLPNTFSHTSIIIINIQTGNMCRTAYIIRHVADFAKHGALLPSLIMNPSYGPSAANIPIGIPTSGMATEFQCMPQLEVKRHTQLWPLGLPCNEMEETSRVMMESVFDFLGLSVEFSNPFWVVSFMFLHLLLRKEGGVLLGLELLKTWGHGLHCAMIRIPVLFLTERSKYGTHCQCCTAARNCIESSIHYTVLLLHTGARMSMPGSATLWKWSATYALHNELQYTKLSFLLLQGHEVHPKRSWSQGSSQHSHRTKMGRNVEHIHSIARMISQNASLGRVLPTEQRSKR